MANQLPTPEQLIAQASAHAKAVTELNKNVTVASGAVVGGPVSTPPPVTPPGSPSP